MKSARPHSRSNLWQRPQRGRLSSHFVWLALQRVLVKCVSRSEDLSHHGLEQISGLTILTESLDLFAFT